MQDSTGKTTLRLRMSQKSLKELTLLLDLDDVNLARHQAGRLIRANFRLRGWLRNRARGKPIQEINQESQETAHLES